VTALANCGALLVAAEGPFLRFYHAKDSRYILSKRIFKAQAVHGICVYADDHAHVTKLVIWGGRLVRALIIDSTDQDHEEGDLSIALSKVVRASDWILDLAPRPRGLDDSNQCCKGTCVAVTAHNALLQVTAEGHNAQADSQNMCAYPDESLSFH
jgi:hypothetical protein